MLYVLLLSVTVCLPVPPLHISSSHASCHSPSFHQSLRLFIPVPATPICHSPHLSFPTHLLTCLRFPHQPLSTYTSPDLLFFVSSSVCHVLVFSCSWVPCLSTYLFACLPVPVAPCPDSISPKLIRPSVDSFKGHPDIQWSPWDGTCLAIFTGSRRGYRRRQGHYGSWGHQEPSQPSCLVPSWWPGRYLVLFPCCRPGRHLLLVSCWLSLPSWRPCRHLFLMSYSNLWSDPQGLSCCP